MKYHNITYDDMLNGSGLRVVLWVSGCSHGCSECHNKVTWNENNGLDFDDSARDELFSYLARDYIRGITFSGGDPLYKSNISEVHELARTIKQRFTDKDIWLYTGYVFEEIENFELLRYVDVLVDGKYEKDLFDSNLEWVGSSNQRVIDLKKTFEKKEVVLYDKFGGKLI